MPKCPTQPVSVYQQMPPAILRQHVECIGRISEVKTPANLFRNAPELFITLTQLTPRLFYWITWPLFEGKVGLCQGFTLQDFIDLLALLNNPCNFREWRQRSKLTYQGLRRAGLSPSERRILINIMKNARIELLKKRNINPAEAIIGIAEQRNTS